MVIKTDPQSLIVTESVDSMDRKDEGGEGEGEEVLPSVSETLVQLGLPQLVEKFEEEMIDFNTFVSRAH